MRNEVRSTHTTAIPADAVQPRRAPRPFARTGHRRSLVATGLVAGALIGGGGYALAASGSHTIHGCVNNKTHALTVQKRCGKGTKALSWNQVGPRGATGKTGSPGKTGATGAQGPQGPAGGVSATVDSASIGGTGFVVNAGGVTDVQHASTGTYTLTATGCLKPVATPQVTVVGGNGSPVVVADVTTTGVSESGSTFNLGVQVHMTETASASTSGGTTTLTTLTNPIPFDAGFFITVTC